MNAFSSFAETAIPRVVKRRIERKEAAKSSLEKKMDEKARLSKAYRAHKREQAREMFAAEPMLLDIRRDLKSLSRETADLVFGKLLALRDAPTPVRAFAVDMVGLATDRINLSLGFDVLDEDLPECLGGPPPSFFRRVHRALINGETSC